jgi:acetate kinase
VAHRVRHSPLWVPRGQPSLGQRTHPGAARPQDLRHISCHLGGSSSLAAFRNGVAIDTSFGTSPQSGLPQNNRVGDIDAFAVLYMMKKLNVDADEMARILGSQSGLAGISGTSGDMRDLDEAAAAGSKRARLALDVFVRAIRHYLGAFLLELGGLDVITFSGGIGENSCGDPQRGVPEPRSLRSGDGRGGEPDGAQGGHDCQSKAPR